MKVNGCILIGRMFFIIGFYVSFSISPVSAQRQTVAEGLDSLEVFYNIRYKMPKGFTDLKTIRFWFPELVDRRIGWIYWVFESKDRQCKVLYRILPLDWRPHEERNRVGMKNIYGTEEDQRDKYLRVFPDKRARESFNADSVFLYDVPTAEPDRCDERFTHCTQMLIFRQGRPMPELVWYFTDEGKKNEQKYMRKVHKRIWFKNGDWVYDDSRTMDWFRKHSYQYEVKNCYKQIH